MSGRVADKVAIVTGGAVGIGAATSRILAREGARVVIADVDTMSGEELSRQIRNHGHHAIFIRHDVALEESWQLTISLAVAEYGGLDVLVNNAAIVRQPCNGRLCGQQGRSPSSVEIRSLALCKIGIRHSRELHPPGLDRNSVDGQVRARSRR